MRKAKKKKKDAAKKGVETKAKNNKSSSTAKSSTAIIATKPSKAAVASKPSGLKKAPPAAVVPYEFSVRNSYRGAYLFIVVIIVDSLLTLNPLFVVNYICRC